MSSKRRGQGTENQRNGDKRLKCGKHLYLVLDDWKKGFSIHKIDADSFDSICHEDHDSAGDEFPVAGFLNDPPAVRLQTPGDHVDMFFTAVDNKIFVVTDQRYGQTSALMYDTGTAGLAFGPRVPAHLRRGFNVVVAAGDALYAFSPPRYNMRHSFEVMSWKPTALDQYNPRYSSEEEALSWTSLPGPPPPFNRFEIIISYAVHPDEHTIFMTTSYKDRPSIPQNTYSFNTKTCVWRWHAWVLPFHGPGFFDRKLDAWVGLNWDGYICSCKVDDTVDRGSTTPIKLDLVQLDHQILEDNLFRNKDWYRRRGASLTYMGASKFCLVETVINRGESEEDFKQSAPDGCALHMTIFTLKYNYKGELRTADHRFTRSYLVAKHKDQSFSPVAFWM